MARLFFGLLLLAGLGAIGFGGLQLFAPDMLASVPGFSAEAPVEPVAAPEPVVAAPEPVVAAAPPPPPPPPPSAIIAAPEPDALETLEVVAVPRVAQAASDAPAIEDGGGEDRMVGTATAPIVAVGSVLPPEPLLEDTLREVPVAYETPATASYGKPFEVTFALDARAGAETATGGLPGTGQIVEGQAKVSERVKASLVGTAFEIELQSPEVQLLGADTENRWLWLVTPKEEGDQSLYVELFALVGDDAKPVRTFNETVTVEVTQFQRVVSLATAANPLAVFLGGIGSTIGGLFGFFRFLRRRG